MRGPVDDGTRRRIIELYQEGETVKAISAAVGRPSSTIYYVLKSQDVARNRLGRKGLDEAARLRWALGRIRELDKLLREREREAQQDRDRLHRLLEMSGDD